MRCQNVEDVGATWKSPANPRMDVSNPEAREGILDTGNPCRYDEEG
jgi:hypothetical protein